jgi:transposase
MMGQRGGNQDQLFYSFNLDDHVPVDHMLRGIDRFLDLADLRQHLASYYSHTGRPSVDPELMIRMLLVGYCFGIRSERRLCDEVHLNLAYRWFRAAKPEVHGVVFCLRPHCHSSLAVFGNLALARQAPLTIQVRA